MSIQTPSTIQPTTTTTTSKTTITDWDIFPVGNSINPSNFMYDGQTILLINSSGNNSSTTVKGTYFDQTQDNFTDYNFDSTNYANGNACYQELISENTNLYTNLMPFGPSNSLATYVIDVTDTVYTTIETPLAPLFFSLTNQPYLSTDTGPTPPYPPTTQTSPTYTPGSNSDNFLFTSNYYFQQANNILIVQMIFTINNTSSLKYSTNPYTSIPSVTVTIYNKVIPRNFFSQNISGAKAKTYGPVTRVLNYTLSSNNLFNSSREHHNLYNQNIQLVFAPGFTPVYCNMPLFYVPPTDTYGQYLNNEYGLMISGGVITSNASVPSTGTNPGITETTTIASSGHFVVGISYPTDTAYYVPNTSFYTTVLIRNIWRSPISIYNAYKAFSVNDMAIKQVVLLFGKTSNGATFLVTNSGTPINMIDSYAVTSLSNFITLMRGAVKLYNDNYSLSDYFTNPNIISLVNSVFNTSAQVLIIQALTSGSVANSPELTTCPNMSYLLLNATNSANLSVDTTNQNIFGQNITSYFGLTNSVLAATGTCKYGNNTLSFLSTENNVLFANSIFIGMNVINGHTYYTLITLPESLFVAAPPTNSSNIISVYSTPDSLFYTNTSTNSSVQLVPATNGTISKINMSVTNTVIIPNA